APDRGAAQQPQRTRTLCRRPRDRRSVPARGRRTLGLRPLPPAGPAMPIAHRRRPTAALAFAIAIALLPGLSACGRDDAAATAADAGASATAPADPAAARIQRDVHALADDRMQGRETGTAG